MWSFEYFKELLLISSSWEIIIAVSMDTAFSYICDFVCLFDSALNGTFLSYQHQNRSGIWSVAGCQNEFSLKSKCRGYS